MIDRTPPDSFSNRLLGRIENELVSDVENKLHGINMPFIYGKEHASTGPDIPLTPEVRDNLPASKNSEYSWDSSSYKYKISRDSPSLTEYLQSVSRPREVTWTIAREILYEQWMTTSWKAPPPKIITQGAPWYSHLHGTSIITNEDPALDITVTSTYNVESGNEVVITPVITGGVGPYVVTIYDLPSWLSYDYETLTVQGYAEEPGAHFVLRVVDASGVEVPVPITINVSPSLG